MRSVQDNAGDIWRDLYRGAITRWFDALAPGLTFSSEALRSVARKAGVGEPHHYNAWSSMAGWFIRAALREERIRVVGEGIAGRPQAHATRTVIYLKA